MEPDEPFAGGYSREITRFIYLQTVLQRRSLRLDFTNSENKSQRPDQPLGRWSGRPAADAFEVFIIFKNFFCFASSVQLG